MLLPSTLGTFGAIERLYEFFRCTKDRAQLARVIGPPTLRCLSSPTIDRLCVADALKSHLGFYHRIWPHNFRDTLRVMNVFRNTNLVAIGKALHTCCDIHGLAEIIETLVERNCD